MIIEFTGCTGAGKSTISREVVERLTRRGLKVGTIHPDVRNTCPFICDTLADVSRHNIRADVRVLPWFLWSLRKNYRFFAFFLKMLVRYSDTRETGICIFRGVLRKIGILTYLKRKKLDDWLIIVDEGIIHSAHNFLVHVNAEVKDSDIDYFSRTVPLPDLAVFVNAPIGVIRERTLARPDRSPRIRDDQQAIRFVDHAYRVFERLMQSDRLASRSLSLYYGEGGSTSVADLADVAVNHILEQGKHCARTDW